MTDLDGKARKFFENAGPDTSPRWSPDGRTLAVASKPQSGNTQWYDKLHLFPAAGGAPKVLLQNFDLDFGAPIWSPDGKIDLLVDRAGHEDGALRRGHRDAAS